MEIREKLGTPNRWDSLSSRSPSGRRLVRSPRIELGTPTWKEGVLPLNYDRDESVAELHEAQASVKPRLDTERGMSGFS
jgi:hypothetical protein